MSLYQITEEQNQRLVDLIEQILQQLLKERGGRITNLIRQDWSIDLEGSQSLATLNLSIVPVWITPQQAQELLDALRPVEAGWAVEQ